MKKAKKNPSKTVVAAGSPEDQRPVFRPRAEGVAAGKALRENVPLERHAEWRPSKIRYARSSPDAP